MARGRKRLIAGCGLVAFGIGVVSVIVASRWYRATTSNATDEPWSISIQSGNIQVRWHRWRPFAGNRMWMDFPSSPSAHRASIDRVRPPEIHWAVGAEPYGWKTVASGGVFSVVHSDGTSGEFRDAQSHAAITPSSRPASGPKEVAVMWTVEVMLWPIALSALASGVPLMRWGRRVKGRARQGLCSACGYNLAGLAAGTACQECGTIKAPLAT